MYDCVKGLNFSILRKPKKKEFIFIEHNMLKNKNSTTRIKTQVPFVRIVVAQEDTLGCVELEFGGLKWPEVREARTPESFKKKVTQFSFIKFF